MNYKEGVQENLEQKRKNKFTDVISSRTIILLVIMGIFFGILIYRVFDLQIVKGSYYLENFSLKTTKTISIPSARGNIYDRNGELLAYNELAYSVTMQDILESSKTKNNDLNETVFRLIKMIEKNGDSIINDFNIILNSKGNYEFILSGAPLLRFLADVYEESYVTDLTYEQQTATAEEVIYYLASRFGIGTYETINEEKVFIIDDSYTDKELLQILTIRYAMSANSYQKYIATVIATEISEKTVAILMENEPILPGVSIQEDTLRKYVDGTYFSHIIGYTGRISSSELNSLSLEDPKYSMNDRIGKAGIEKVMELELQGQKGTKEVVVDNLGKSIEVMDYTEPIAGNDIYLTIDKNLQIATYDLIEKQIAGILLTKIVNQRDFSLKENETSGNIKIPITDVYFALIDNSIINISAFSDTNASETEQAVLQSFLSEKNSVFNKLKDEIETRNTVYNKLTQEYQVYESYIVNMLFDNGVLLKDKISSDDATYINWKVDETISLRDFLYYAISENWIDVSTLDLDSQYSNSEEIFASIGRYIFNNLEDNTDFHKKIYKYMLKQGTISGKQICMLLWDQDIITIEPELIENLVNGNISAYDFMIDRIRELDITPAQLALDPCSGSCVVTDVNNGDALALVTYPSYDNNRLANTVDAAYYAEISSDLSNPLWDYATQQKTAPGSTYKMVTASAGLEEGVITPSTIITCLGTFDKLTSLYKCWISPGTHGPLTVKGAIEHSCNYFFYEVGYRLSQDTNGYNGEVGINTLKKYADLYGLTDTSGIEIMESTPEISSKYPVLSAIGQGNNNFTTVGLARYVTTVANRGTCYNLTLLDKMTDGNGNLLVNYNATIRNTIDFKESTWDNIQEGMRLVVESKSYYNNLSIPVSGKTGTAQESETRANHSLFVGYAPSDNPEIAVATRIAYGYSSDYAAEATRNVIMQYFKIPMESIEQGTAIMPESQGTGRD